MAFKLRSQYSRCNKYVLLWYALIAECIKLIFTKLKGSFTERDSLLLSAMHSHIHYFDSISFYSTQFQSSLLLSIHSFSSLVCNASLDSPDWFLDTNDSQFKKPQCRLILRFLVSFWCCLPYTPFLHASSRKPPQISQGPAPCLLQITRLLLPGMVLTSLS